MYSHFMEPRQFRLYGAALAIAALAIAIMLAGMTAGPAMAQEIKNSEKYDKPIPCSEEVEPDANTTEIARKGYYAVFDGFWDYEVDHLSNNFCPPKVVKTTKVIDDEDVQVDGREDGHLHISKTVFAIPESYKVTVVDTRPGASNGTSSDVTGPTIDLADYRFLEDGGAVSAGDSLYWVRLDEPDTDADETSPLQIGFSTGLLKEADWYKDDDDDPETKEEPVQFRFAAVHVLQDGTLYTGEEVHQLGAHMFAFDQRETDATLLKPEWSNVKTATESELDMFTGKYRPMQFVFTKPGQYLVQAQVQGHVRQKAPAGATGWERRSSDITITSPVQWYTFHVGPEADLSVNLTAGEVSTTGDVSTVPVTVTAVNSGPNAAKNVEVEINLPAGLSATKPLPAGATSTGCGVIAWKIGTMAAPTAPATPTKHTLRFNATVDPSAAGKVTATAEIRSTTFDPNAANNAASVEVTLSGTNVRPPYFPGVTRTIVEHAVGGAHAGDPVAAVNPDGRVLHYSLTGPCGDKFQVHSNGQIVLAHGQTLDYEEQWEYPLILHVSDGVNADGTPDPDMSADDSTPVLIQVQDTDATVHPEVTFTLTQLRSDAPADRYASASTTVWIRSHVSNSPAGATLTYAWEEEGWQPQHTFHESYYPALVPDQARSVTYTVHVKWEGGGITASHTVDWSPR